MKRDQREYGLTPDDREWVLKSKFGIFSRKKAEEILNEASSQSDKVLGAILFLTRPGNLNDLEKCVELANENESALLNAATVKDERT